MTSSYGLSSYKIHSYSKYNLSETESDIPVLVQLYRDRVYKELQDDYSRKDFLSFAETKVSDIDLTWLEDNTDRFIKDTPNKELVKQYYPTEYGFILCMTYSSDGETVLLGYSTGLIQVYFHPIQVGFNNMSVGHLIVSEYAQYLKEYYNNEKHPKTWYPQFYRGTSKAQSNSDWITTNHEQFLKNTPNRIQYYRCFFSEKGFITSMQFSPSGTHVIVGHSSGLIEMRNGVSGAVLCTLRNIQFPPKPVYALEYSPIEENVCYAACMDGAVYRIEIPHLDTSVTKLSMASIRADPVIETLNTQFYGSSGISYATPFILQRVSPLSLGLLSEQSKMVVGYADTSVKVFDIETQEVETTYKVHKSRLPYIPKKLQRNHFGQVVALRVHPQKPFIFASGAWDKTLRIWDVRCKVGCIMTFEGVDICGDSIDLNREQCISGSWQVSEALCLWDLTAKKKVSITRVQNRRADVDGEYIYACRYWRSTDYNRKGKYGIIGGSGTKCVEVINLHNRYITCSYPALGTVLAVASHQERIAFGGTYPAFCIVSFHDPKHEKALYEPEVVPDYDYTKPEPILFSEYDSSAEVPFVIDDSVSQVTTSIITSATTAISGKSVKAAISGKSVETEISGKSVKSEISGKSVKYE